MIKVGTAELKNKLSLYLNKVKNGAHIIVTDRGLPIAKITSMQEANPITFEEKLTSLVASGILTHNFQAQKKQSFRPVDIGKGDIASSYVIEDRE